jgi:hypothetical protein
MVDAVEGQVEGRPQRRYKVLDRPTWRLNQTRRHLQTLPRSWWVMKPVMFPPGRGRADRRRVDAGADVEAPQFLQRLAVIGREGAVIVTEENQDSDPFGTSRKAFRESAHGCSMSCSNRTLAK